MTKQPESMDRELKDMKSTMDHYFLSDFDGAKLRVKIREAIRLQESSVFDGIEMEGKDPSSSALLRGEIRVRQRRALGWRRFGPLAASVAAVCLVLMGAAIYSGIIQRWAGSTSKLTPTIVESEGLFSSGFQPISVTDAARYQHVDSITVLLGNVSGVQTPESVDGVTVQLTANQQQMFYHIMQASQMKSTSSLLDQTTSLPLQIWLSASDDKGQYTYSGYYSTSGAMTFGSSEVYASNPALAQFMNQYVLNQLLQKYQNAGKLLPNNLSEAAVGFVHNLGDPSIAYKYCVPDMVFSDNTSIGQLQSEAGSRGFSDFQIQSITYGPGGSDATVVLKHPNRLWTQAMTLNLVRIANSWLVIQAATGTSAMSGTPTQSTELPGSPYDGQTPVSPFGQYHILIIGLPNGVVTPTGNTSYGKKGQYTTIGYNDLNSPAYQSAQIIIYERTPLTKESTSMDACQALKNNPAFQKAVAEAKAHHAVLVVTGGDDNLLTRDMMVKTLGVQSTTGDDTQVATTIAVWFVGADKALFSGITVLEDGKPITHLSPSILDDSMSQAALILDTWGGVMG